MAEDEKHCLDGNYIIYEYGIYDGECEGRALALYRLEDNEMEEIYHPSDYARRPGAIGEEQVEGLIKIMKSREINKVYSVNHIDDFFWSP